MINPSQIKELRHRITAKERECMMSNCNQSCINSHVIQESRYLKPLSNSNGQIKIVNTDSVFPGKKPSFRNKTTGKVLSFKGFCHFHDELIFAEIEKRPINFDSYKHLLLLNYRAICHEQRKKEKAYELIDEIIKSVEYSNEDLYSYYDNLLFGLSLGGKELSDLKLKFEKEIIQDTSDEFFIVKYSLERMEIVSSAIFTIQTRNEEPKNDAELIEYFLVPEPSIIISIVPTQTSTEIILCTEKKHEKQIKEFIKSYDSIKEMINSVLLQYIESWACSEVHYNQNIKPNESEIIRILSTHGLSEQIEDNLNMRII